MDFTTLGAGLIVGDMIGRYFTNGSPKKIGEILLPFIGLILMIGSKYHLFGG